MGKFCPKCGTALLDDAAFCHGCGSAIPKAVIDAPAPKILPVESVNPAPADASSPYVPQFIPAEPEAPAKKEKKSHRKALLIGGIVGFVAVLVAVTLIFIIPALQDETISISTPEGALENYYAALNGNADCVEAIAPDSTWQLYSSAYYISKDQLVSRIEQALAREIKRQESYLGKNVSVSYTITHQESLKSAMGGMRQFLGRYVSNPNDITDVVRLEVKQRAEGADYGETTNVTFYAVKIESNWYLFHETKGYPMMVHYFLN